jgi:FixJ family two-component response regulator
MEQQRQSSVTRGARGTLIAIVDDEFAVRESAESLFRSAGFAAECFESAEDFLLSPGARRAECVVLDIRLPGLSGLQLQEHLGNTGSTVRIVFITAQEDGDGRLRARALEGGAVAFLRKPCSVDELLAAVGSPRESDPFGSHGHTKR